MRAHRTLPIAVLASLAMGLLSVGTPYVGGQPDPEMTLVAAALRAIHRNVEPNVPVVYPSPAYYNPYLRDSFWVAQVLGNRRFSVGVLTEFAAAVNQAGDPPTMFVNAYKFPRYHDDESAALFLIWAWRNQYLYGAVPPMAVLQRVLRYLLNRAPNGMIRTPAGPYGSWWDAYSLPGPGTLSYVQGLYAVALRCAQRLGLPLPLHAIALAEVAYRGLYDPRLGYLPLSTRLPASDASALTGEFLSLWLFGYPMLPDNIVLDTVRHLTPFGAGFRVVNLPGSRTPGADGFLPAGPEGVAGDYQNGASWLLYDALSIGAAGLHGRADALPMLRARLDLEFSHGDVLHEYLRTNPLLAYYGGAPSIRNDFAWDTFSLVIDHALRDYAAHHSRYYHQ